MQQANIIHMNHNRSTALERSVKVEPRCLRSKAEHQAPTNLITTDSGEPTDFHVLPKTVSKLISLTETDPEVSAWMAKKIICLNKYIELHVFYC